LTISKIKKVWIKVPISRDFKKRIFPLIPQIMEKFSLGRGRLTPSEVGFYHLSQGAHIYDERGLIETISRMKEVFFSTYPGNNFFAVKACPNVKILEIIVKTGFGLDCASPTEIYRAKLAGADSRKIMYTSNNTELDFFKVAMEEGCIINLDDISYLQKLSKIPEAICFRYNPGEIRAEGTNSIIGNPPNQKYGVRDDQVVEAYTLAKEMGSKKFGIHTMYTSNCRDYKVFVGNARMQLEVIERVQKEVGIKFDFFNIGGGLGIPYHPDHESLDIEAMADGINAEMRRFKERNGYVPLLYMESGRYVMGPNGILVGKVINIMEKYKKFIGVNFCDGADILRAGIYPAYHEVSVITPGGEEKTCSEGNMEKVSIVGPLCENIHMVSDRDLPIIEEEDYIAIHDTGAHGIAMGMNYNGWGKSQELLMRLDNSVERIGRPQTIGDLLACETP